MEDVDQFVKLCKGKMSELKTQCDELSNTNLSNDLANIEHDLQVMKSISNKDFKIIFIGFVSAGKSTVLSALLEMDFLPSAALHTTRCFFRISASKENKIELPGGEIIPCSDIPYMKSEIAKYTNSLEENNVTSKLEVKVFLQSKSPILANNVYLYDTYGLRGANTNIGGIKKILYTMDVMIIVMDYNMTEESQSTLKVLAQYATKIPIVVLINKWDEVIPDSTPKQIENAKKEIKEFIKTAFGENFRNSFYISAYNALNGNNDEEFASFKNTLSSFITEERNQKYGRIKGIQSAITAQFSTYEGQYYAVLREQWTKEIRSNNQFIAEYNAKIRECNDKYGSFWNADISRRSEDIDGHLTSLRAISNENFDTDIKNLTNESRKKKYADIKKIQNEIKNQLRHHEEQYDVVQQRDREIASNNQFIAEYNANIRELKNKYGPYGNADISRRSKDIEDGLKSLREISNENFDKATKNLTNEARKEKNATIKKIQNEITNKFRHHEEQYYAILRQGYRERVQQLKLKLDQLSTNCDEIVTRIYKQIYKRKNLNELVKIYSEIKDECPKIKEKLNVLEKAAVNSEVHITCIGQVSAGKSQILNALLGRIIMKSTSGVTTRCTVQISKDDTDKVILSDNKVVNCPSTKDIVDTVHNYMTKLGERYNEVIKVYLSGESSILCHKGVHLYDTPGMNTNTEHFVYEICKFTNILIIVVTNNITPDIRNVIDKYAHEMMPIFILINKWDEADDDAKPEQAKENLTTQIKEIVELHNKSIIEHYFVSANEKVANLQNPNKKQSQRLSQFNDFSMALEDVIKSFSLRELENKNHLNVLVQSRDDQNSKYEKEKNKLIVFLTQHLSEIKGIDKRIKTFIKAINGQESVVGDGIKKLQSTYNAEDIEKHMRKIAQNFITIRTQREQLLDEAKTVVAELTNTIDKMNTSYEAYERTVEDIMGGEMGVIKKILAKIADILRLIFTGKNKHTDIEQFMENYLKLYVSMRNEFTEYKFEASIESFIKHYTDFSDYLTT